MSSSPSPNALLERERLDLRDPRENALGVRLPLRVVLAGRLCAVSMVASLPASEPVEADFVEFALGYGVWNGVSLCMPGVRPGVAKSSISLTDEVGLPVSFVSGRLRVLKTLFDVDCVANEAMLLCCLMDSEI